MVTDNKVIHYLNMLAIAQEKVFKEHIHVMSSKIMSKKFNEPEFLVYASE